MCADLHLSLARLLIGLQISLRLHHHTKRIRTATTKTTTKSSNSITTTSSRCRRRTFSNSRTTLFRQESVFIRIVSSSHYFVASFDDDVNSNKKKKASGVSIIELHRCFLCCVDVLFVVKSPVENGLRRKKNELKEQPNRVSKATAKTRNANVHSPRNQSRATSPYFLRRFLALFALAFGLEVNQNECRQAGKLSRLKIRKNHALRMRDWVARSRSRVDDANVKTYKKPPQTHLQLPLVLLLHHYRCLEQ